jgi:hypothetical protein
MCECLTVASSSWRSNLTTIGKIKSMLEAETGVRAEDQQIWCRYVLRTDDSECINYDPDELLMMKY